MPGHADGLVPQAAFQRREQFPRRGLGRHFPVIDHHPFASVPGTHDHEPAAADIAGFGERDGQRECHGHGRVDRVAAALQRGQADLGRWPGETETTMPRRALTASRAKAPCANVGKQQQRRQTGTTRQLAPA